MTKQHSRAVADMVRQAVAVRASRSPAARRVRVLAGASQAAVGAASLKHQSTIANYEAGVRRPRGAAALAYTEALVALARELRDDGVEDAAVAEFVAWGDRLDARRAVTR